MAYEASIRDCASALMQDLIDSGSFAATEVSTCDFGVLDTSNGCAVVIQPLTSTGEKGTWSAQQFAWGIVFRCFLWDEGNPQIVLTRKWDIHDAIAGAVLSGSNTNITGREVVVTGFNAPEDIYFDFGGKDWIPVNITVRVEEDG